MHPALAQYWQQRIAYTMDVVLDDQSHRYQGTQKITYWNNSPDELNEVYFHLFPNAFQPGSQMDVRSRNIVDPDPRVNDLILKLRPEELGMLRVTSLTYNGRLQDIDHRETILVVTLDKPLRPGKRAVFNLEFEGQVPLQIRRSGRDSREGIAYSMAQWYPKMCEYDHLGWHAYQYIGREFHGVYGSFDVKITLDSAYTIASTGVLQNANRIGKGYLPKGQNPKTPAGNALTWHFKAENVHDFAWAADKEYRHISFKVPDGPLLRFFHKDRPDLRSTWDRLPEYTARAFTYANEEFGRYPYPEYVIVQGGDGGMEYPMMTLITGQRRFGSLVGVVVHELVHSWYQLMLGSNEALYPWMDEGFTTYAGHKVMSHLFEPETDKRRGTYFDGYISLAKSGLEEPMSKHADHYNTNYAYFGAAYNKGGVFIGQLGYVVGDEVLRRGLKRYYDLWKFKHPSPYDFIKVMEQESGMHLGWYLHYMMNTTEQIDYAIAKVEQEGSGTLVRLERIGNFPMPIDLDITYTDGSREQLHIPVDMMMRAKKAEDDTPFRVADAWPWTHPTYTLRLDKPQVQIARIDIDQSLRLADVDRSNNSHVADADTNEANDNKE